MQRRRRWQRWLNAGTAVLVLVALGTLVRERILPAWRSRAEVRAGEKVPEGLRYRTLASADTLSVRLPAPTLHLVFQSGCPACRDNLPAWRRLLARSRGVRALAVGLEPPEPALAYVREQLSTALAVRPLDVNRYVRILRISVVPTTFLLDGGGRLVWRRAGRLSERDLASVAALATELRGPVVPTARLDTPSPRDAGRSP